MKKQFTLNELKGKLDASAVTLGNFDGVHVGHREILHELDRNSKDRKIPSVAITFHPHPALVLGYAAPPLLTTIRERVELFYELGVQYSVVEPFTKEMASTKAYDFVKSLCDCLKMKVLCIGPTTHVGKGREGTPERLVEISKELGFALKVVPAVLREGEVVNSSRIRKLLQEGDVTKARELLSRPFSTEGRVVKGDQRGASIGFATANLGKVETLLPGRGVYATVTRVGKKFYPSATNIGVRPTFRPNDAETVETHIIGFTGDVTGSLLNLFWIEKLREEKKFGSPDELRRQISADIQRAKGIGVSFIEELK